MVKKKTAYHAAALSVLLLLALSFQPTSADPPEPLEDQEAPVSAGKRASQTIIRGTVEGIIFDMCGQFRIDPDPGFPEKWVDAYCSTGGWQYWTSLVGKHIEGAGTDVWNESCGIGGMGGWTFCASTAFVPTKQLTWSTVKALYR